MGLREGGQGGGLGLGEVLGGLDWTTVARFAA